MKSVVLEHGVCYLLPVSNIRVQFVEEGVLLLHGRMIVDVASVPARGAGGSRVAPSLVIVRSTVEQALARN